MSLNGGQKTPIQNTFHTDLKLIKQMGQCKTSTTSEVLLK